MSKRSTELTLEDLKDLPEELLKQLHISDSDRKNLWIVAIVREHQPCSLDQILVQLYKRHALIENRVKLMARMYRLSQKGQIQTVPSRKGIYQIVEENRSNGHIS